MPGRPADFKSGLLVAGEVHGPESKGQRSRQVRAHAAKGKDKGKGKDHLAWSGDCQGMGLGCSRRLKEISVGVLKRWIRLIKSTRKVRKLQRLWGIIGPFIRDRYSKAFKQSLLAAYPEISPPADMSL